MRENRRIKAGLMMARLTAIKTLSGFDFAFQPSLDRNRILALAELKFIDIAVGVEAVKAGKSVYFATLADIVASLARAEREGHCASASAICAAPRS